MARIPPFWEICPPYQARFAYPSATRLVCSGRSTLCKSQEKLRASVSRRSHRLCDVRAQWWSTLPMTEGLTGSGRRGSGGGTVDELPIGRRVAYWRGRRKMSQQVFADRLGKSKSWVDKVERGVRRLDKFSVVYEIADVLAIDVQLLLGKDVERRPETQNCIDQVEVEEIRAALERYDQMSAFFHPVPQAPPLAEMRKAVSHAWLTYP